METMKTLSEKNSWDPRVSLQSKISSTIIEGREKAYQAISAYMLWAFSEVGRLMLEEEMTSGEVLEFKKDIAGISPATLEGILRHALANDMQSYVNGHSRYLQIKNFLDFSKLSLEDFKNKYPRSFLKWSEKEEGELTELWNNGVFPSEIARRLQRNTRAIRLRAERLGLKSQE